MWSATAFSMARGSNQEKSLGLKFPRTYHSKCCSGWMEPILASISARAFFSPSSDHACAFQSFSLITHNPARLLSKADMKKTQAVLLMSIDSFGRSLSNNCSLWYQRLNICSQLSSFPVSQQQYFITDSWSWTEIKVKEKMPKNTACQVNYANALSNKRILCFHRFTGN